MARYPFACSVCSAEFDVEREAEDLVRPVACPLDGAVARRVYGVAPAAGEGRVRALPFGAFWHDHGPGTEPHLHGSDAPVAPAVAADVTPERSSSRTEERSTP
jgi:hypothetical protein